MGEILWLFVSITVLFFLILFVREFLGKKNKEKVCSICLAFSLTWIVLLVLFWSGKFLDKTIIALMMGMTLLGVFYIWERKVGERSLVFRLPLLLTLVLVGYSLIEGISYGSSVLVLFGILWIVFGTVYLSGSKGKSGSLLRKIVECCKKW